MTPEFRYIRNRTGGLTLKLKLKAETRCSSACAYLCVSWNRITTAQNSVQHHFHLHKTLNLTAMMYAILDHPIVNIDGTGRFVDHFIMTLE